MWFLFGECQKSVPNKLLIWRSKNKENERATQLIAAILQHKKLIQYGNEFKCNSNTEPKNKLRTITNENT